MTIKKLFISYSRKNSEFASQLAKELQQKGANVWFDLFSIEAGSAWDSSIDEAIDEADTVLFLLSKSSVESENVLDEIAYALEEKKIIVPIIIESCKVPFRINRLTKYDFTKNLQLGMISLFNALGLNDEINTENFERLEKEQEKIEKQNRQSLSVNRESWYKLRERSLLALIAITIPILADIFNESNFRGLIGLWVYFFIFVFSLILASGLKLVLKRFQWGKRFLNRFDITIAPTIILFFTLFDLYMSADFFWEVTIITLGLYLFLLLLIMLRIPNIKIFSTNVDYFINLFTLILLPILYLYRPDHDYIIELSPDFPELRNQLILLYMNIIISISLIVSTALIFLSRSRIKFGKLFIKHAEISFLYILIILSIVDTIYHNYFRPIPVYLLLLFIGHTLHVTGQKTEFQIK